MPDRGNATHVDGVDEEVALVGVGADDHRHPGEEVGVVLHLPQRLPHGEVPRVLRPDVALVGGRGRRGGGKLRRPEQRRTHRGG